MAELSTASKTAADLIEAIEEKYGENTTWWMKKIITEVRVKIADDTVDRHDIQALIHQDNADQRWLQ